MNIAYSTNQKNENPMNLRFKQICMLLNLLIQKNHTTKAFKNKGRNLGGLEHSLGNLTGPSSIFLCFGKVPFT